MKMDQFDPQWSFKEEKEKAMRRIEAAKAGYPQTERKAGVESESSLAETMRSVLKASSQAEAVRLINQFNGKNPGFVLEGARGVDFPDGVDHADFEADGIEWKLTLSRDVEGRQRLGLINQGISSRARKLSADWEQRIQNPSKGYSKQSASPESGLSAEKVVEAKIQEILNAGSLAEANSIAKEYNATTELGQKSALRQKEGLAGIRQEYKYIEGSLRDGTEVTITRGYNGGSYKLSVRTSGESGSSPKEDEGSLLRKLRSKLSGGSAVILIPMIGFGLVTALSGVRALNGLPFGQMAQRSEVRVSANRASAYQWGSMVGYGANATYTQYIHDECMNMFVTSVHMCDAGNHFGCEMADDLQSSMQECSQFINTIY